MKNQTRRDFLIRSGLGTVGLMTGIHAIAAPSEETSRKSSTGTYNFSRKIPVDGTNYDIVVIGGGPAGVAASVCSARLGAKVLLLEATGCFGGMGTSGLVTCFDPMANGEQMLVGGLMRDIIETLYQRNSLIPDVHPDNWRKKLNRWTPYQVEAYKLLLDELVVGAKVNVQFFTKVIDVDADSKKGRVTGVITHNIEGCRYIKAKTFIDCTGDGVIAKLCGAVCRDAGTDTPHIMPSTLMSLFTGINWDKFDDHDQWGKNGTAIKDGHFTQIDRHLSGMNHVSKLTGNLNGGHVFNLNALRCKDLTDGMILGRKIVQEYKTFYRKYVNGCENIELVITADVMGIRESRRILGEYELNIDDYVERRKFSDQIGVYSKFLDNHPYDTSQAEYDRFNAIRALSAKTMYKSGEYFGLPYGILVPKGGWKNFWVAGRCASSDVQVHGSIRVQPACSMMGQAAGTAAVQSIKTGQPANDLDTEALIMTLRDAGANLPQTSLSKKMTRN